MHVVDGLKEREHGAVVGDAAPAHVVALHAVEEGGDGVLQSFEELLVVLLGLSILIRLLEEQSEDRGLTRLRNSCCTHSAIARTPSISSYFHYVDRLHVDVAFSRLANGWDGLSQGHRGRRRRRGTLPSLLLLLLPVGSVQVTCELLKKIKKGGGGHHQ